jgi:hypothetical protein
MRRIPTLAEVGRRHVLNTLHLCGNNRTHAAKVLGLSIRGLRLKLHEYERHGIAVPARSVSAGSTEHRRDTDTDTDTQRGGPAPDGLRPGAAACAKR